ncbi:MAG TPA: nucleotidyltransferase family protein, partial [Gemmatimonadaceae bacterium]|nr:nucleotidyltransferase family protein [Gemmatimonadaceae bacterium]
MIPHDPALLRRLHLAAYACTVVDAGHPLRRALYGDLMRHTARHAAMVAELAPLLQAWHDAGVSALLYKGMHLSAFVYPVVGTRFHGDVDILVSAVSVQRAVAIARELHWEVESLRTGERDHNAATLSRREGATAIDLHRWAVHRPSRDMSHARHITDAVWARATHALLGTAPVFVPDAVDALLVGLVLERTWGDRWMTKAHDPIDWMLLRDRDGVTREALMERAGELGCPRTLASFLARFDPDTGLPALAPPGRMTRAALELRTGLESGLPEA